MKEWPAQAPFRRLPPPPPSLLQGSGGGQDLNLLRKRVGDSDSGGHPALFLAIYEVSALNRLPNPMMDRALVELHFLGQGGERNLSNIPLNTFLNSAHRLPDRFRDRSLDPLGEQPGDQFPDDLVVGHHRDDPALVIAGSASFSNLKSRRKRCGRTAPPPRAGRQRA